MLRAMRAAWTSVIAWLGVSMAAACASLPEVPTPMRRPPAVERGRERVPTEAGAARLRVVAGGDVMFGRYVFRTLVPSGGDRPFEQLAPVTRAADLALVNLETPLSDVDPDELVRARKLPLRHLRFRAPTRYAGALADAGVDVAVLANNHAEDCGEAGLAETLLALEGAGVGAVGASVGGDPLAPLVLDVSGVRVAVLAATTRRNRGTPKPGQSVPVAFLTTSEMLEVLPARVRALREGGAEVVLVTLHWGGEFTAWPNRRQQQLARALVDAGATAVLGHHAHVLQPVEAWGDGIILYNMGNLVFDMVRIDGRRGAAFELTLARAPGAAGWRAEALVVHPLLTRRPGGAPALATGAEADAILDPLAQGSRARFETPLERVGDTLRWRAAPEVSAR